MEADPQPPRAANTEVAPEPQAEEEAPWELDVAGGFLAQPPGGDHRLDAEGTQTWRCEHKDRSSWEEDGWYKRLTLRPGGAYDWSVTTYNIDLYDHDRRENVTEAHGRWAAGSDGTITLDGVQGTRTQWDSFKEHTQGNPNYQGATRCPVCATLWAAQNPFFDRVRRRGCTCAGKGAMAAPARHRLTLSADSLGAWTHSVVKAEPWCARRLASGMCLHERLGALSPASTLPSELAQAIAVHLRARGD